MRMMMTALAILISTAAGAADYKPGPYAGVTLGYASGALTSGIGDLAKDGIPVSGIVGYTHKLGPAVLGIEGEITWDSIKGKQEQAGYSLTISSEYTAALKARGGMLFGDALVYIFAGPSWTSSKLTASDGIAKITDKAMDMGITAGLGTDLQMTDTLALRIEAARTVSTTDWMLAGERIKADDGTTTIKAGLLFRLN